MYDDACAPTDVAGNAQLSWLFEAQDIILPGPYLVTTNTSYNRIYSSQVGSAAGAIAQQHGKPWVPYLMAKDLPTYLEAEWLVKVSMRRTNSTWVRGVTYRIFSIRMQYATKVEMQY